MVPPGIKGTERIEPGRNVGGDFISSASGDGSGTNNPKTASQPWQISTCEALSVGEPANLHQTPKLTTSPPHAVFLSYLTHLM